MQVRKARKGREFPTSFHYRQIASRPPRLAAIGNPQYAMLPVLTVGSVLMTVSSSQDDSPSFVVRYPSATSQPVGQMP